jgi:hypothetical protein
MLHRQGNGVDLHTHSITHPLFECNSCVCDKHACTSLFWNKRRLLQYLDDGAVGGVCQVLHQESDGALAGKGRGQEAAHKADPAGHL